MSTYVDKPLSLIERKKLQWAREKEELAGLSAPWGNNKDPQANDRAFQRGRYVPKLAMANNEFFRKDAAITRRSSLPPLSKNQYNSVDRELGGETSGYGSDNPNQAAEPPPTNDNNNWTHEQPPNNWNQSGYESSSSFKDDRPKWKDKTKFWDVNENDPPNWVKRGLQRDEEIVVSNTSPAESPQQDEDAERPYTGCSGLNKTFIRGQNIRVDSSELAERERRREIALAHQDAIRQQLADREKRRQEEKQQRIKEEQEEELRIEREQEMEKRRKDNELRIMREKQERERKRKEAIQEALEIAEREAKLEKKKQKMKRQNNLPEEETVMNSVVIHNDLVAEKEKDETDTKKNNNSVEQSNYSLVVSPKPEVLNNDANKPNFEVTGKVVGTPRNNERSLTPRNNERSETPRNIRSSHSFQLLATPRTEMALVLQAPYETLQNMQYAVLMPNGTNAIPIAIPLAVSPPEKTASHSPRTENRILTPTQYRGRNKTLCDSSTQTEHVMELNNRPETDTCSNNHKYIREKLTNLELNYDNRSRKERRSRSDDRCGGEKPKWGANRPPTRYMKQSEKDPFYQRRKQRQKREYRNSSDDSQMGSPRTYRKKNYVEKRQTRALWRKNDHYFARNIRMYQTEIVPLESDKEQIYYPVPHKCECCCRCRCETKTEILKIEHTSPRDRLPDCNENVENATYIIDKLTSLHNGLVLKQEQWERSPRTPSLSSSTRNTENN